MRLGVISDTHGWLDPHVKGIFAGVDAILHAGDIGAMHVIEELSAMAPVHAVRGNVDRSPDLLALPEHIDLQLGDVRLHVVHRPVDARPGSAGIVIAGHTHKPLTAWRDGVLWLNPGAAGRRGFHTERTLALLELGPHGVHPLVLPLGPRSARPALSAER